MTTPPPVIRGMSNPAHATPPNVMALGLAPRYAVVDLGDEPLPEVDVEGMTEFFLGRMDEAATACLYRALAIRFAVHARFAALAAADAATS